jgi:tripartite-type tricarboxylate transporter receptor subunit TctC
MNIPARLALVLLFAIAWIAPLAAQTWPDRPMRFIVSQAAGGTPDILCRMVTERVGRALGQQIVVENRPGGGNVIGAQAAARAAPDGYTFFWATAAALVTNPYTFKSLPYDPARDFVPVGKIADGPFLVLANPAVPAKSLAELFAYAKAEPGKLAFATDGPKNFSGLIAAWLNKRAATDIAQVPYAAMPQGSQDVVAGRVQLVILAIPSAAPLMASGSLHALAITTRERAPGFEQIPPVAETFPGFDFSGWMAVAAPAGTPADILQRMNRELDLVLNELAVVARLREIGFYTQGAGSLPEIAAYVRAQYQAWGEVIREIGITPD